MNFIILSAAAIAIFMMLKWLRRIFADYTGEKSDPIMDQETKIVLEKGV